MSNNAQILANRNNAIHSTGPRTEAGKSRSSGNAATHGMTSTKVLLPYESEEEYNALRDSLIEQYAPANTLEFTLAVVVAETFWRRQRVYRIETAFLNQRMNAILEAHPELSDGDDALSTLFTDPAEISKSRLLLRYLTAAERAHKSAVTQLEKVQKARRLQEREEAELEQPGCDTKEVANGSREEIAVGEIGFVSQPIPAPSQSATKSQGRQKKSRRLTRRERRQLAAA